MSITPEPGGTLPREERDPSKRPLPPPPPPPGYSYAAPPPPPPPGYGPPTHQGYAPPPPAPPQSYAPPPPPPPQSYAPPPPPPPQSYAPPPAPPQYAPPPPPPPTYSAPAPSYPPPPQQPQYAAPPQQPSYSYGQPAETSSYSSYTAPPENTSLSNAGWFGPVVLVALVVLTAGLFLVANNMGTKNDALKVQLVELKQTTDALRNELEGVNAKNSKLKEELSTTATTFSKKLGATQQAVDATKKTAQQLADEQASQAQQTKQATAQLGQAIEGVRQESASKIGAVSSDVGGVKNELGATKKDLDATKASLKSAMGDLGVQSGLIARNHDDVEALRKRNERNYFEFNIVKAKTSTKVGDIGIKLTKTDPKKGRYTLEILADDKTFEKKDKTANEPLQFYVARARGIPYEVVVNQVDKDRIVGYLATPK